jgi:hypothetical protein
MPIANAEMHKARTFLPRFNQGSRFLVGLEGYWPLIEGQGRKCNSLLWPSSKAIQNGTPVVTFTKSIPFGMTMRIDDLTTGNYPGLKVENSDLGMWSRFDGYEYLTMAIWVKLDTRSDFEPEHTIFGFANNSGYSEFIGFCLEDGSNKVGFRVQFSPEVKADYSINICNNSWYFLTATWNWVENLIRLYLNGVQTTTAATIQHGSPATNPFIWFGSVAGANALDGNFFGAGLWTRCLSAQDIYYLYTNPFELLGAQKYPELNAQAGAGRISDFMPFF